VLAALQSAAVPVLPLKVSVLRERLYGDPLARLSIDLDLLVREEHFGRAQDALQPLGYQIEQGPTARYRRRYHQHLSLTAPRRPTVELHFRAFAGFGTIISAEALFAGASQYRTVDGHTCLVAAAENEFVYLCAHSAGHDFERLAWLYDIKTFLDRHPRLEPESALARARSLGVGVAVAFALEVLYRRLDVGRVGGVRLPARASSRWQVAFWLLARLEGLPAGSPGATFLSVVFQSLLCDRLAASLRFLQHHLSRIFRRRLQRVLPGIVPAEWSG